MTRPRLCPHHTTVPPPLSCWWESCRIRNSWPGFREQVGVLLEAGDRRGEIGLESEGRWEGREGGKGGRREAGQWRPSMGGRGKRGGEPSMFMGLRARPSCVGL